MNNFKLDKQLLTSNDMVSLITTLKGINSTLENKEIENIIDKIQNLVPNEHAGKFEKYSGNYSIDITPFGYRDEQKHTIKIINESLNRLKILSFTYTNNKGETICREIEPITLIFKGYAWYLFGFCLVKSDYRLFKISRMRNVNLTEKEYLKKNVKYDEYVDRDYNPLDQNVKVKLRFSQNMKYRVEEYFEEQNIVTDEVGNLFVETFFPKDEWIYSFVLGFGENVEIIEPIEIREIIAEKIKKIYALYKHDITVSHL